MDLHNRSRCHCCSPMSSLSTCRLLRNHCYYPLSLLLPIVITAARYQCHMLPLLLLTAYCCCCCSLPMLPATVAIAPCNAAGRYCCPCRSLLLFLHYRLFLSMMMMMQLLLLLLLKLLL